MGGSGSGIDELRITMCNVGRAFVGVDDVAARSRKMTRNARLAASRLGAQGAAFNVVVQALDEVVVHLTDLVGTIEAARAAAIGAVARFTASENALRLTLAAAIRSGARTGTAAAPSRSGIGSRQDAISSIDPLQPGIRAQWAAAAREHREGSLDAVLADRMLVLRDEMLLHLGTLRVSVRQLNRLIEAVDLLASSHAFFIGINGVIEAAYIGNAEVAHVAEELRELTVDIRSSVGTAKDEAAAVVGLAEAATATLTGEIGDARARQHGSTAGDRPDGHARGRVSA